MGGWVLWECLLFIFPSGNHACSHARPGNLLQIHPFPKAPNQCTQQIRGPLEPRQTRVVPEQRPDVPRTTYLTEPDRCYLPEVKARGRGRRRGDFFSSLSLKALVGQTASWCTPGIHSRSFLESDSVHPSITVFGPQPGENATYMRKRAENP